MSEHLTVSLDCEISFDQLRCRACLCYSCADDADTAACGFVDLLDNFSGENKAANTNLQYFNEFAKLNISLKSLGNECRYLCGRCYEELQRIYEFQVKVRLSDEILLKEQMQICKTETKIEEEQVVDYEFSDGQDINLIEELDDDYEEGVHYILSEDDEKESTHEAQLESAVSVLENDRNNDFENNELESQLEADNDNDNEDNKSILVKLIDSDCDSEGEGKQLSFDFSCELCLAKYDYQRELMQHYEQDHAEGNLQYSCDSCEIRCFNKNALRLHVRQIHEQCEYIDCQQCGRIVLKSFYRVHVKRHSLRMRYLCKKCPNSFTTKYTLHKHMKLHVASRERNVPCGDCDRKFFSTDHLNLHQQVHRQPEQRATYACTLCEKSFFRTANLKLHMKMHRGDQTMDCEHCGKKFVRRKDLEIHVRFHTGDFPYVCDICGKRFAIKGHLNYHEKKHSGVRYKCSRCEKQFLNLSGLRQHSFEHTGMPLECNICSRGFATKFKMRRHLRSVHHSHFDSCGGYTDALADKYITKHKVSKIAVKNDLPTEPHKDNYFEIVEFLEEHENDIAQNMLVL